MSELIDTFSNRLNKAMLIRNMKATELSEKTGIAKSSLSEYINGKYEAKQDGVYLLAKALEVNEAWLMGLDVPMEKELPYSAIYDFSSENDKNILNSAITYAIQNCLDEHEIQRNDYINSLLLSLDELKKDTATEFILHFAIRYKGVDEFNLSDCIESLKYYKESESNSPSSFLVIELAKLLNAIKNFADSSKKHDIILSYDGYFNKLQVTIAIKDTKKPVESREIFLDQAGKNKISELINFIENYNDSIYR